ncbi:hypothetical protein PHMEG_00035708 [Phytophthora megakarya]|uniref:Uncharacterized protein n=1 Tax=Phytophthora megakarya TaxID=4795 RepID=A0A225UQV4_9STRA|nr:hypothetical protein PHMEG_00035708 [Phytophthora megakarya]
MLRGWSTSDVARRDGGSCCAARWRVQRVRCPCRTARCQRAIFRSSRCGRSCEAGWARKPPPRSSLDDGYFYIRPGFSTKGTEGVDFVRGKDVVLEFYASRTYFRNAGY